MDGIATKCDFPKYIPTFPPHELGQGIELTELTRSAHQTPNFTNPEYFFVYFLSIFS